MKAEPGSNLRDRRRRATRREIRSAALRLAREHTFEAVTVDMISAEAGVSTRTFFNHFPNRDAAFVLDAPSVPEGPAAEFMAWGPASAREVLADLTELMLLGLEDQAVPREELHATFALAQHHPQVLAALLTQFDGFQQHLIELVARRQGLPVDDEVPGMIAAVALAAARQGIERWARSADDGAVRPHVQRSLALISTLLTPSDAS